MPYRRICILLLGFVLDIIAGDPLWLPHPVQGMGKIITLSEAFFIRLLNINGETHSDIIKKKNCGLRNFRYNSSPYAFFYIFNIICCRQNPPLS